jgi:hypothetical protein
MGSVVAFILVLAAAVALAYLLENVRRSAPVPVADWNGHGNGNGLGDEDLDGLSLDGDWLRPGEPEPYAEPSRRRT